jgi:Neuraminidase (sialidase)
MVMEWTYQPIYANAQRAFHDRLEIVLETGVGATTGQGSDPKIMLKKSDDGGKTWQALPDRTFGKRGERLSRAVWHNLGSARKRVYKASVSDPVPVTVVDTVTEVRGGRL